MTEQTTTDSVRDALEASYDAVAEADAAVAAPESTPVESESTAEGYEPPASEKSQEEPEKAEREYSRDEHGKFAEKQAEESKKQGITPGPKGGSPKERPDPIERAPQAWKPEAREHWSKIPEAARREILRTEQSIQQTLRETVEDRRLASAVKETIRPFEHLIKAEGSDPIRAIDNLLTTAARLRTGNVDEVAGMVVELVKQFGTGRFGNDFIRHLDSSLAGQAPRQVDPYVAQMEQRMRAMEQAEQQRTYQAQQAMDTAARTEIEQFRANAEFLDDVRNDMADLMEMAGARGQAMTIQEAYDRACWANPEIRSVIEQRRERERAQQQNQVAQRARSAAVSVGGSPAFNASQEAPSSLRDAIEFAMRK